jgi:methenyltetrahydromethanopterin cyclohydrolase
MPLNAPAVELCDRVVAHAESLRIGVSASPCGARLVDCGVRALGGLEAGLAMAEICLAGLARVALAPALQELGDGLCVTVATDHPVAACLASQYAGWRVKGDRYFAMGSGPMRAAAGSEAIFDAIGRRERPARVAGILETASAPPDDVCRQLAAACGVEPPGLTLLYAPTASLAGAVQIVARALETALHKLHALDFDLERIVSGWGLAPLPPIAAQDLEAIGPRAVSSASPAYGEPFATIFERAGRDFYRIDPGLFSPARLSFVNLDTGASFRYGRLAPHVLRRSFGVQADEQD